MKNFYIIIVFAILITISACTKNNKTSETSETCVSACSAIQVSSTTSQISTLELEGGMYYGGLDRKKKGTPDDWVHVLEGTKSESWRSPESGKNYMCDCDKK